MLRGAFAGALLLASIGLASCSSEVSEPEQTGQSAPSDPLATPAPIPPQVADFPSLESRDCREVAQFYLTALQEGDVARAALVWNDPVIDGARLQALLAGYQQPRIEITNIVQEGAAGSSYCTVTGTLTDTADLANPPEEGELLLRRVNDVPGATPDQLRWTLRHSTFLERLERSARN